MWISGVRRFLGIRMWITFSFLYLGGHDPASWARAVARSGRKPGSGSAEGGEPSAGARGVPAKTLFLSFCPPQAGKKKTCNSPSSWATSQKKG